jgi:rhamnosyltransferase subunit B
MHQTPRIVLATFGTHGDLHPFMALALALQRHGARVTLAAAPEYRDKIEAEGLAFAPMRPGMQAVMDRLGMDEHALTRRIDRQPQFLLTHIVMPALREAYEDIMAASTDADALVSHSVAYGAKLAAEQRGLPDFSVALQPMVLWSIHDPPIVANAQGLSRWVYRRGPALTRAFIGLGQRLGRRWARPVDDLRRALGLPPSPAHPLFEGAFSDDGVLALFSPLFGAPQPDHPPHTDIVGFAFHDREAGVRATLDAATTRFLQAGPPPLVFTQGTSAVHDAEDFVRESLDAVRMLGIRAVFVLDDERATRWKPRASDAVHITGYAPYARLFPEARAIIHHGGIGTTAQALRSGRPQLVVPHLVDQPDNAARVERLGVGRTLARRTYRADQAAATLDALLGDAAMTRRAAEVGEAVSREDGAEAGARRILDRLRRTHEP